MGCTAGETFLPSFIRIQPHGAEFWPKHSQGKLVFSVYGMFGRGWSRLRFYGVSTYSSTLLHLMGPCVCMCVYVCAITTYGPEIGCETAEKRRVDTEQMRAAISSVHPYESAQEDTCTSKWMGIHDLHNYPWNFQMCFGAPSICSLQYRTFRM